MKTWLALAAFLPLAACSSVRAPAAGAKSTARASEIAADPFPVATAGIERFCGRHQVIYQRLLSNERLEHILFDTLRRRGVLR